LTEETWGARPAGVKVYPKAQVLNRFIAKFIDVIIVAAVANFALVGWLAGMAYVLIADGFPGGQSIGKRLIGLQTVVPNTHDVASFKESVIRNLPLAVGYLLLLVPYIGWVLILAITTFEALLIIGNDQGLRLGDEFAHTQVLDAGELDQRE